MGDDGSEVVLLVVGDDQLIELFEIEAFVVIGLVADENRVQEFKDFFIVDVVSCASGEFLDLIIVDVVIIIDVQVFEDGSDAVFGLHVTDFVGDEANKVIEVDGFFPNSKAVDDVVEEGAFSGFAEFFHDFGDFLGVDVAGVVFIEEFEGIAKLFVVFRVELFFPGESGGCCLDAGGGGFAAGVGLF